MNKFLNHIFHWDSDQGTFNKALSIALVLFGAILIVLSIAWSYGIGNNILSHNGQQGEWYDHLVATGFLAIGVVFGYLQFSDKFWFQMSPAAIDILLALFYVLVLVSNCGWRFPFA